MDPHPPLLDPPHSSMEINSQELDSHPGVVEDSIPRAGEQTSPPVMQLSMEVDQDEFEYPTPRLDPRAAQTPVDRRPEPSSAPLRSPPPLLLTQEDQSTGLAISAVASADLSMATTSTTTSVQDDGEAEPAGVEKKVDAFSEALPSKVRIISEDSFKPDELSTPNAAAQAPPETPSNGTNVEEEEEEDLEKDMPQIASLAPEISMEVLQVEKADNPEVKTPAEHDPEESSVILGSSVKSANQEQGSSSDDSIRKGDVKANVVSMGILEVSSDGKLTEAVGLSKGETGLKSNQDLMMTPPCKAMTKNVGDALEGEQPHLACTSSELVVVKQEHLVDEEEDGSGHLMGSHMVAEFARFNDLSNTATSLLQRETDEDLTNYTKTCLLKSHHTDIRFVVRKTRGMMSEFITVQGHSLVLCQYSALIAQMVQQVQCPCHFSPCYHPQPSLDIFLPDFPVAVFRDLLSLCYTGSVGICTHHRFMDISELANVLQIDLSGVSFVDVDRKAIVRWPRTAGTPVSTARLVQPPHYAQESPRETPSPMPGPAALSNGAPFNDRCYICFSGFDSASKLRTHLVGHFAAEIRARYPLSKDVCELCGRGVSQPVSHIALKHGVLFDFVTYEKQPSIFTCHFVKYRKLPVAGSRSNELGPDPEYPEPTISAPGYNSGVGSGNYVRKSKRKRKGKWLHVPDEHIPESLRDREGQIEVLGTDDFM